jgi:hypothetical protein
VAGTVIRTLVGLLRSGLFVALLLASRVLVPVLRLMATAGIVVFGFCALARRDEVTVMWAGAGLAGAAVALELALAAAIRALAPSGVVVISEV